METPNTQTGTNKTNGTNRTGPAKPNERDREKNAFRMGSKDAVHIIIMTGCAMCLRNNK